jgi:hypothetical protein
MLTPKDCLKLPYKIDKEIQLRKSITAKHRDSLYGRSVDYSASGGGSGAGDALGAAIASVRDYEADTDKLIAALVSIRFDIEHLINGIHNSKQREVLIDRYLLYMPWKNRYDKDTGELIEQGIKEKTGYSEQSVYKFHTDGLEKISVPEKIRVKYSEIEYLL